MPQPQLVHMVWEVVSLTRRGDDVHVMLGIRVKDGKIAPTPGPTIIITPDSPRHPGLGEKVTMWYSWGEPE